MVSVYCFVTKACTRRTGAAASVERRRCEHRILLAGAAGELAGATHLRQARPSSAWRMHILRTGKGVNNLIGNASSARCLTFLPSSVAYEHEQYSQGKGSVGSACCRPCSCSATKLSQTTKHTGQLLWALLRESAARAYTVRDSTGYAKHECTSYAQCARSIVKT